MTREEIEKKAQEWVDTYPKSDDCAYSQECADCMVKCSFIQGAEWMQDELFAHHQTENYMTMLKAAEYMCNLRDELINKSCEWLDKNLYATVKTNYENIVNVESRQVLVERYKKAMKDECN